MNVETFRYDNKIVRAFAIATVIWAIVGMAAGLLAAVQLYFPAANLNLQYTTFGRLRPLHTNAVIFAFVGNGMFMGIYYSLQRLCKARMFSDALSWVNFWGWNVIIVSAVTLGVTLVAWLLAIVWGRQPVGRFTAASAPVWAIAMSTQSSLASLPAMLDAALRGLGIPARIADVILPLAVAVFRFTSPVANLAVVYFCAHLYGIEPTWLQIGVGLVVAYAVSIAAVGLPGQVSFVASIAPICLAMGVPTELLGILIAVEIVPDIFRTLGNVTGDLAATSILARNEKRETA